MNRPIIEVKNLSKSYQILHRENRNMYGSQNSIRKGISSFFKNFKSKQEQDKHEKFFALENISFNVNRGEVIGVIGKNGSGKSTLLKILSRISDPSSGKITLRGRSASLLEAGTGFHSELTGRENVYLNGVILGMSKGEISSVYNSIVDFAGVSKFIDTPIKRYSTGMVIRLAFSVAAHLNPEILIIDEVLAVGDAEFQSKCLDRMNDFSRHGGKTIFFVSHNMNIVKSLCTRSIMLETGKLILDGETTSVVNSYLKKQQTHSVWERAIGIKDKSKPCLLLAKIISTNMEIESHLSIEIKLYSPQSAELGLQLVVHNCSGQAFAYGALGYLKKDSFPAPKGESLWRVNLSTERWAIGSYRFSIGLLTTGTVSVDLIDNIDSGLHFEVFRQLTPDRLRYLDQEWSTGTLEVPLTIMPLNLV